MKRLLMITGLGSGTELALGKQGAFYNTLEEFHKHWARIDIIIPKINGNNLREKIIFDNVHLHISYWPLVFHPFFFIKKGIELCRQHKIDLMTVQDFPPFYNGIGARIIWQATRVPYVLEIHHIVGFPQARGFKEKLYRLLSRWFLAWDTYRARAVRVVNQNQTPLFLKQAGVPSWKIQYIPSIYIDSRVFYPRQDIIKDYDMVFAGRLESNKNALELIKAVEIIKKSKPDISILIIGSGSLKEGLEQYVASHDLKNNVVFSGWLESPTAIAEAYSRARIFVNPSLNEGGPRVALEAMACGLPLVTTRVGLMPDIIKDGENGLFCDWDSLSIASAIERMLNDRELQERCAVNSRVITEQFERVKTIAYYTEALKQTLGQQLLVIAQKVNQNDDLVGFFISWLREFSKHFNKVFVITLEKGTYDLPSNVSVFSLGKEVKSSRFSRILNFYKLLFDLVPETGGIFAHMSPIFAVASWPVAAIFRKRIVLWYLHRSVTFRLKVAEKLCYKIVTADRESLKLESGKIIETGHGIKIDEFKTDRNWTGQKLAILSVGRISKIKDYETLLEAARILKDKNIDFKIKIVGQPIMPPDFEYQKYLLSLREKMELEELVEFVGFVPYSQIARYYKEADLVVGLTPHGGIDKTILEGMASGCLVLTSNEANRKYFGSYANDLIFNHRDPVNLANKIESLAHMSPEQKNEISNFLTDSVSKYHNLIQTIEKISNLFSHA